MIIPLNKIIQKPDISQTKNNSNTNKQTQNNTIGDKMKMFEKKEEKITLTNKQRNNSFILKHKNFLPNKNQELEIIRKSRRKKRGRKRRRK